MLTRVIAALYAGLAVAQVLATFALFHRVMGLGWAISILASCTLGPYPLLGSFTATLGAHLGWDVPWDLAILDLWGPLALVAGAAWFRKATKRPVGSAVPSTLEIGRSR